MQRILLVDDHEVIRQGIRRIFEDQERPALFGEAGTPQEALDLVRQKDWDLVILDLSLGKRSGLELLRELIQMRPKLRILILSMHSEEQYARRAFQAGAAGYVTKGSRRAELIEAIDKIMEGGVYVSPNLAEALVMDLGRDTSRPLHEMLSDREFEVFRLIGTGKQTGEIAEIMSLSIKTISTYRSRILLKMGIKSNADIIRYGIQSGLIE